ncbi:MerR family transcriptional regulator [Streptomyces shenzhenensis]|uniref:MerR family transcriptional regulator n=1 Tax=Streptomyces shenzhenensis TaxID=943815 RepID=UPI0033D58E1D
MSDHDHRDGRRGVRLRTVDLARAVGVSTQQIRNYEDAGVLPPAERSAAGYRSFREVHRQALLTYRSLPAGFGTAQAARIMRAVHAADVPGALALVDAAHAALHEERAALRATGEALESLAGQPPEAVPRAGLRIGEIADLLGVRTSALRVWEDAGLLTPGRERGTRYRRYSPADVRDARLIHTLRRAHHGFGQLRPVLDDLRREGNGEALRARTLTARSRAMLAGSARLHAYLDRRDRLSAGATTTGSTRGGPGPSPR